MAERISSATIEFGRRIRAARTEQGLTQEQLAEIANLHWTYVGQVERGERNISLKNILRLKDALRSEESIDLSGLTSW